MFFFLTTVRQGNIERRLHVSLSSHVMTPKSFVKATSLSQGASSEREKKTWHKQMWSSRTYMNLVHPYWQGYVSMNRLERESNLVKTGASGNGIIPPVQFLCPHKHDKLRVTEEPCCLSVHSRCFHETVAISKQFVSSYEQCSIKHGDLQLFSVTTKHVIV